MTDSVAVFPPGYRLTDSATGAPIIGATLSFYDAGTTNPQTVYADKDLTTSLGTSVVTDSLGRPTSDGDTPTDIFVGTAPYKVVIKDASATVIETKDNRPGAVVSAASGDVSVIATRPVVTKSLDYTVLIADQSTIFAGNSSSGSINFTFPSAVTAGNGFFFTIQHAGSANKVICKTASSQLISDGSKSYGTQFVLSLNGEEATFVSDGGNWRVANHTPPFIKKAQGVIPVVSRLATSPSSPSAGDLYILTGTGGSWSGFATGDIAFYTGAAWVNYTPPSNCGWRAWVQGESLYYSYISSAWAVETGTSSQPGTFKASSQSAQETGTANDTATTPGTQQFHPSAAKCWGNAPVSGGVPSLGSPSYNMTSLTDTGTGDLTITIATDFSSAVWACNVSIQGGSSNGRTIYLDAQAAGTAEFHVRDPADSSSKDPASWMWSGFGDQ